MASSPAEESNALLDACQESLRAEARLFGARVRALVRLDALADAAKTRRFLELEVAGSLSVGQLTASRWLAQADRIDRALPITLTMLEAGDLLVGQALAVLHTTAHCPEQIAAKVEAQVLPAGADLCPGDLRRLVAAAVMRIESEQTDAAAAEQRHADAAAQRRTFSRPGTDGMGLAGAVLTAEQLQTWSLGLDELERAERVSDRAAGNHRTADQRRAHLFAALPAMVLAGRAGNPGCVSTDIVPQVVLNVHVPMATVLDLTGEPGTMDGYGPVSAEHVRLLRPTLLRRVVVDAQSGRPVAVDDKTSPVGPDPEAAREQVLAMLRPEVVTDRAEPQHDPSARLARLIDLRDVRCAGPGCGSTHTDRDHLKPYPEGPTAAWNLGRLSARCHAAKHHGWTLVRHPDGSTTWTSPLNRTYSRPSPHRPPPPVPRDAEPPPLRPPPTGSTPRWVTAAEPAPPAAPENEGLKPDRRCPNRHRFETQDPGPHECPRPMQWPEIACSSATRLSNLVLLCTRLRPQPPATAKPGCQRSISAR